MVRRKPTTKQTKVNEARVIRAFAYAQTPINILDLSKVSAHGLKAIEANPEISDEDLNATVKAFITDLVSRYPENQR